MGQGGEQDTHCSLLGPWSCKSLSQRHWAAGAGAGSRRGRGCSQILLLCRSYDTVIALYELLPEEFREESRLRFGYLKALSYTGREKEVLEVLDQTDFVLDDLREGETALGALWHSVYKKVHGEDGELPQRYRFDAAR